MIDLRDRARALKSLQPKERFFRLVFLAPVVLVFISLLFIVPGGNWNLPVKIAVASFIVIIFFWRLTLSYRAAKFQMELEHKEKQK
ncbi:hypothetical protein [Alkalicoccobacillus porphyridii]|uniref:Uncharacterized protein n=1 Tax=Alkalicoccobacillus porphyridii TaxID=2597270 RepID=A0A553ZW93_9BACI|nr:hypothetical protein [Alkalicoccobacillus porphyridii]TSB45703.1 hypothetical protein FN960_14545 [Alkalicoccobacillus porphyridii]